jgi:3-deoxy-D-manno-octulosonate 8-phosphate phosphatase (KDO 8-P phosphatase)
MTDGEARRSGAPEHDIRLVITDFDGVMTDNRVVVFQDGREAVVCNRADGLGCSLLRDSGIEVVVLSTETNPVVAARGAKLAVEVVQACADKREAVREIMVARRLERRQVVFVGNDVNDLPAFGEVGFTVAPSDAHADVRAAAGIVTTARGGEGVLRELADHLQATP